MMFDLRSNPAWDLAHARWLAADALVKASDRFGPATRAAREYDFARRDAEARHGGGPITDEQTKTDLAQLRIHCDALGSAEYDRFVLPADIAAVGLITTPAPTIEAVHIKLSVIEQLELQNREDLPIDLFTIIEADVRRLGFNVAASSEVGA